MRPVTRNLVLGIVAVLVLLLALGALPGLLTSGDPYYVTATVVGGSATATNASGAPEGSVNTDATTEALDATELSARSYPYTTAALANASTNASGRSRPYWKGPVGFKEAFTHSPFDEVRALGQLYPNASVEGGMRVTQNGTLYRVAVTG